MRIDKLIHEPARLKIIANLYVVKEVDFIFLKNQAGMTWGNLSSHLSKSCFHISFKMGFSLNKAS
ncbi:hypothetical protein LCGC14_1082050 [marine sediment metagenome]|uniref:Winged helix DNA-binding domain-containing protein n=1 Tax=marine sediment metagenome TaxID=412755 RepID=A0A0F9MJN4_9ZZZZ|nr:MAG: hypothetical protein Lokiarch_22580 [Candidatus Lokiarchaeum sp. GC14_75]